MIFEPKAFYQAFLKDYHKIKATYLKRMLDNLSLYEQDIYGKELDTPERDAFRMTIKSDLRQTYFHSIETFFELFFALNPKGKKTFNDEYVLYNITNSKETYSKIKSIADKESELDFLDEIIDYHNFKISIGHYLFYKGIFSKEKFPEELFEDINNSIESIKIGIRYIATDFVNRDEYNAYKHGLRIIPVAAKLKIADPETMEVKMEWDLTDSMSFYLKTNSEDELTVVTKLFDSERDYQMTFFCSNLIHHLIYYRRLSMNLYSEKEKNEKVKITIFGKELVKNCSKINVAIQDLVYTIKRNI
jgi:hypothetical protein